MSNVREFPLQHDVCVDEAGDWIAKLGDGLSEDQERELGIWLSRSDENYRIFMELAELWDRMDALSRLSDICPEPAADRRTASSGYAWPIAATVLLGIALTAWLSGGVFFQSDSPAAITATASNVYETVIGKQSTHELSDGTTIVLNTNTLVSVNYTESNRLVTLVRGEMHVSVAHDPSRPLSVIVSDRIFQAVGTEFNLEIKSDQNIELIVTDGLVMVGISDSPINQLVMNTPLVLKPLSTLVAAGQEVTIDASSVDLASPEADVVESENISIKLSWREGNLIFRGESLEEAVSEVGRYTAVEFVFLDEESKKVRVAGLFKAGDVEGLLVALRTHFNISYEWQGDDKIFLSAD